MPTKAERDCRGRAVFCSSQAPFCLNRSRWRFVMSRFTRGRNGLAKCSHPSAGLLSPWQREPTEGRVSLKQKWVKLINWCPPLSHKLSNVPMGMTKMMSIDLIILSAFSTCYFRIFFLVCSATERKPFAVRQINWYGPQCGPSW